ncbi:MAG: 2-amino-4-hydroxy-6-hydroxymethyldihydropteridine diphosphokinase [Anaerohalosphaeraceae bacterium]|nr:2-amino-4-hydroxy-6-hydroxymethyldihydropteridine diphosphokinase [Anaerohalosphaeraceae bacterium]
MSKQTTVYIGLGSNMGAPAANFRDALRLLGENEHITVCKVSREITTKPLTGKKQGDYLNAVAELRTDLNGQQLLDCLKQIESSLGRVATSEQWLSRPIDLDILFFGDRIIDTDSLTIPHRQLHLRSFVLDGLCELAPNFVHPILKESVSVLADRLNDGDFYFDSKKPQLISIAGVIGAGKTTLADALAERFNCEILKEAYSENPFMPQVYAGDKTLALDSQLFFLRSRVAQLSSENLQPGRIVISDYVIDKEKIYASAWLDSEQLKRYNEINIQLCESVVTPAVVIYLRLEPRLCLERIHSRNRPYEQDIDLDFLQSLDAEYERLFSDWTKSPLFRIDSAECDFRRTDCVESLAEKIEAYISAVI